MIIVDTDHHDLEVVYGKFYVAWKTCPPEELLAASGRLSRALHNLQCAGYTPEQIEKIERHALVLLDRAGVKRW
jgi:hypothetical protein